MRKSPRRTHLAGRRFGRLTAIEPSDVRIGVRQRTSWLCRCDCGTTLIVETGRLTSGNTRSCGCLAKEVQATLHLKHGGARKGSKTRLYRIWMNMHQRCYDPNFTAAHRWGGRGIKVCEEWHDFATFRAWARANGYADDLSIDRIDNDGDYEPSNCRWATPTQQARNTRLTRFLTYRGRTRPAADWAEDVGLTTKTLTQRIDKYGWSVARAISTPRYGARGENRR